MLITYIFECVISKLKVKFDCFLKICMMNTGWLKLLKHRVRRSPAEKNKLISYNRQTVMII